MSALRKPSSVRSCCSAVQMCRRGRHPPLLHLQRHPSQQTAARGGASVARHAAQDTPPARGAKSALGSGCCTVSAHCGTASSSEQHGAAGLVAVLTHDPWVCRRWPALPAGCYSPLLSALAAHADLWVRPTAAAKAAYASVHPPAWRRDLGHRACPAQATCRRACAAACTWAAMAEQARACSLSMR